MIKDTDWQLLSKARQGNKKAFGQLVEKYQDKALYLALDLIGNFDDAQDIAQNAFLKAFEKLSDFKGQSAFSTWLYRIVVNLAIDHRRAEVRRHRYVIKTFDENIGLLNAHDPEILPDRKAETENYHELIKKMIHELPEQQRIAFTLRHYHGMSMKDIAEVIQCQPGTVRSHIFRALNTIREKLNEMENDETLP